MVWKVGLHDFIIKTTQKKKGMSTEMLNLVKGLIFSKF